MFDSNNAISAGDSEKDFLEELREKRFISFKEAVLDETRFNTMTRSDFGIVLTLKADRNFQARGAIRYELLEANHTRKYNVLEVLENVYHAVDDRYYHVYYQFNLDHNTFRQLYSYVLKHLLRFT